LTKTIDTLSEDIDSLFREGKIVDEANLELFLKGVGELIKTRLARNLEPKKEPTIRMSKLGVPDRKLWYEFNTPVEEGEVSNALKFVYGDLVEQLVIFLAKEAGHLVEEEQQEVEIDGVVGHKDLKLDGVTTDIKSASSFAFRKFATNTLYKDDPFGYIAQLSSYMYADNNDKGAFVAVNKENGQIAIVKLEQIDTIHPPTRIKEVKELIVKPAPPEKKCYEPNEYGKSGNLTLNKNCNYCPFKDKCWSDANNGRGLRKFRYASGVVDFVEVVNEPRVEEVLTNGGNDADAYTEELE
jgi:hypothetical protein